MFMMDDDDGTFALGNIIHINLKHFLERDEEGRLYADISSPAWTSLEHTLVHEFTHAFMTDYNRAGMLGDNSPEYSFYRGDQNYKNMHMDYYDLLIFPSWFIEGTASTTDDFYLSQYVNFSDLAEISNNRERYTYTMDSVLSVFTDGSREYWLNSTTNVGTYLTGSLACLYLYELMARTDETIGSAFEKNEEGKLYINTDKLRMGFCRILECLHNGETLDELITRISHGAYADTADYENTFIKGSDRPDKGPVRWNGKKLIRRQGSC